MLKDYRVQGVPLVGDPDSHICSKFWEVGDFYEGKTLHDLLKAYPIQKTIVDVGANIGNHAAFFATFFQHTRVVAIEPHMTTFEVLHRNLEQFDRATAYRVALSDHDGSCSMVQHALSEESICYSMLDDPKGDTPVTTLDSFALRDVTLLKIDAEGSDVAVLKGAMRTIRLCRPIIVVELNSGEDYHAAMGLLHPLYTPTRKWFYGGTSFELIPTELLSSYKWAEIAAKKIPLEEYDLRY